MATDAKRIPSIAGVRFRGQTDMGDRGKSPDHRLQRKSLLDDCRAALRGAQDARDAVQSVIALTALFVGVFRSKALK
jgi:hypothetical protein